LFPIIPPKVAVTLNVFVPRSDESSGTAGGLRTGNGTQVLGEFLLYNSQINYYEYFTDRLCGPVVRVLGYRSGGPDSIPGTTREEK
jgi:hypothetical protein